MKKYKPQLVMFILSMLLLIMASTITAHAGFYNGGGHGSMTAGSGHEGASKDSNAFMVYFTGKETGGPVTHPMIIYANEKKFNDENIKNMEKNFISKRYIDSGNGGYSEFKFADAAVRYWYDSDAPMPISYNGNWVLQGDKVRKYLEDPTPKWREHELPEGSPRYLVILKLLCGCYDEGWRGDNGRKLWNDMMENSDKYSVVVQPVAILHPYGTGTPDGIATADGWAKWLTDDGKGWYSHSFITGAMYNCMTLEFPRWDLSVPSSTSGAHTADYNAMHSVGYGIHIIDVGAITSNQTTCDEPEIPAPHDPPNESTGEFKIVKCYRAKTGVDASGKTIYQDKGTFVKDDSSPNISVEDEWKKTGDYKLKEFFTSKDYVPTLKSTDWEKAFYNEKTISFTLGVKEENIKPRTDIYKISQSTITRKVKISFPDYLLPKCDTLQKNQYPLPDCPA